GFLSRSLNGRLLAFTGYNTNVWSFGSATAPRSTAGTAVPRQINTVNGLGFHAVAFKSTTFGTATGVFGVATDGTNNFWAANGNDGTSYISPPSTVVKLQAPVVKNSNRSVKIFNGDLWFSTASGSF